MALIFPSKEIFMEMLTKTLTTNEVVALFNLEERRVRKEVEHGVLESPRFALPAILYLRTVDRIGFQMTAVDDKKRLYGLIVRALETMTSRVLEEISLRIQLSDIAELRLAALLDDVTEKVNRFEEWKRRLVEDDAVLGGEPSFPKTRLAVRNIGGMRLRGASLSEIREDYPYLTEEDIEFAKTYTRAYPPLGRPSRERETAPR